MGCNNTLTDDQLEVLFTTTDEEMLQIEQSMECLIERTKYKCKRCTSLFFSNEAALKQHHCKPPIKKEKHPHCGKTINRANNLEKHLRSCEKAPTHPAKQQLHQTAPDGLTSSDNGPSTHKKLIAEKVEHWKAPEIVESTLKYAAHTFTKTFNSNNKRDLLQWLKEVIHSMKHVIDRQIRAKAEAVKWYLSLNMNFCKSRCPTRQIRLLRSAQRYSSPLISTNLIINFK